MERCVSVFLLLFVTIVSSWSFAASEIRSLQKRSVEVADQLRLEDELKRVKRLQEDEELSRVKRFDDKELSRQKRSDLKRIQRGYTDALSRVKRLKRAILERKLERDIALHRMKRGEVEQSPKHASHKEKKETKRLHKKDNDKREFKKKRMEMALKRRGQLGEHRVMKKGDPKFHRKGHRSQFRNRMAKHRRFNSSDRKRQMRNLLKRHHVQHHRRNDVKKPKRHTKRS
ncbi:RNA-binding protein 25-like [Saccostrea echinata]|uniref:RNA-binding protein 25-like n=1 Tax=Saccostrea echinata TaxID=191078 RepID=UPI002A83E619|nr:RNA-binding protein 25-like [Saccostrea echinata]